MYITFLIWRKVCVCWVGYSYEENLIYMKSLHVFKMQPFLPQPLDIWILGYLCHSRKPHLKI